MSFYPCIFFYILEVFHSQLSELRRSSKKPRNFNHWLSVTYIRICVVFFGLIHTAYLLCSLWISVWLVPLRCRFKLLSLVIMPMDLNKTMRAYLTASQGMQVRGGWSVEVIPPDGDASFSVPVTFPVAEALKSRSPPPDRIVSALILVLWRLLSSWHVNEYATGKRGLCSVSTLVIRCIH